MTCGAFQIMYGKIYSMYSVKLILLISIFLFEIGSAVCEAAPNSISFIVGRAVAGIGAAGILAGSVSIWPVARNLYANEVSRSWPSPALYPSKTNQQ